MNNQATTSASTESLATQKRLPQTLGAFVFGIVILLAVGFAPMDVAHNAAHDVRHTLAFPCH